MYLQTLKEELYDRTAGYLKEHGYEIKSIKLSKTTI